MKQSNIASRFIAWSLLEVGEQMHDLGMYSLSRILLLAAASSFGSGEAAARLVSRFTFYESEISSHKRLQLIVQSLRCGSANVARLLALSYVDGEWLGMEDRGRSLSKARLWYARAARYGDAESARDLALMLLDGQGGRKHPHLGLAYLLHAKMLGCERRSIDSELRDYLEQLRK